MSMSMRCLAVKPADEAYKRKAEAYRACETAGVPIPDSLEEFFNYEGPDSTGVTQEIGRRHAETKDLHPSCRKHKVESEEGFEVDISQLPEGTRFVRFYCSW